MIESCYWREDLLKYAKEFAQKKNPPRWSERLHVNFEKKVILAFFMIRKLSESNKLSPRTNERKVKAFRSKALRLVNNRNAWELFENYDLENEEKAIVDVKFICNQLIHGGLTSAYRLDDRNWGGIHTCSDYVRSKYVYRFPIAELIDVVKVAAEDYPDSYSMVYNPKTKDYDITTSNSEPGESGNG
jgi:hypothetical protein